MHFNAHALALIAFGVLPVAITALSHEYPSGVEQLPSLQQHNNLPRRNLKELERRAPVKGWYDDTAELYHDQKAQDHKEDAERKDYIATRLRNHAIDRYDSASESFNKAEDPRIGHNSVDRHKETRRMQEHHAEADKFAETEERISEEAGKHWEAHDAHVKAAQDARYKARAKAERDHHRR